MRVRGHVTSVAVNDPESSPLYSFDLVNFCFREQVIPNPGRIFQFSTCKHRYVNMIQQKTHFLHSYLLEIVYSLHTRSHTKSLVCETTDLNDHSFLVRATYKDC